MNLTFRTLFLVTTASLLGHLAVHATTLEIASCSTITAEIANAVGGDKVHVDELLKPGVDPHTFEPTPSDLIALGNAKLILASGKHMESYSAKLKDAAARGATLLAVGDTFPSLKMKDEDGGTGAIIEDPHWWHSVANMKLATNAVRDALEKLDPADQPVFAANAEAYQKKLDALKAWAQSKIAELPRDQRKLVTSHDAFQYFSRAFGFTVYPIEGVSTQDEASSKKVAEIIQTIKQSHVKAVFFESIENPKVLQEITRESGAKIGGELYADGLGSGDAATYEGMLRHNVNTIVNALK
ncbi:MAG: metal ABC transporter substrate-binding protein [Chthoniobacteraceae bacterium]